jgi:hypothetical protein
MVHLREVLSNLGGPLERLQEHLSVHAKYSNSDNAVPEQSEVDPGVRRALLRDNRKLQPAQVDELVQLLRIGP